MQHEVFGRSKLEMRNNIRIEPVGDNLIFILPGFKHDFGDAYHHEAMMRTVEVDEEGEYIPWTGPNNWKFEAHEILDTYVFYPINQWMWDHLGDRRVRVFLRLILGIFWGLNCCFPPKDVLFYTIWGIRGYPAVQVLKKVDGKWINDNGNWIDGPPIKQSS